MRADLAAIAEAELARTDLALALAARRESEDRAQAVMERVGDGILTFDSDGVVRSANPAAERAFGTPPGGLAGARVDELQAADVERLRALGAAGVIAKPFDPMGLAGELDAILGGGPGGGARTRVG